MASYNFSVAGGQDNTVRIPVANPGGTLVAGRFFVSRDGGAPSLVSGITVTFDGDYAVLQIPSADASTLYGQWQLLVSTDGTNFVPAAQGRVKSSQAVASDVRIQNTELEISNAEGAPLPVMNMAAFQNVRSEMETAARGGYGFTSSTGVLAAGAIGSTNFRGTLSNPVGSGKTIYVAKLNTYATSTSSNVALLINPTAGLPTTPRPINNVYVGHPNPSIAVLNVDASATGMTGGTDSGIRVPIVANRPEQLEQPPYIIPPGVTLGLAGPFSAATELVVTIQWWEA